jgi:hypothetical protein
MFETEKFSLKRYKNEFVDQHCKNDDNEKLRKERDKIAKLLSSSSSQEIKEYKKYFVSSELEDVVISLTEIADRYNEELTARENLNTIITTNEKTLQACKKSEADKKATLDFDRDINHYAAYEATLNNKKTEAQKILNDLVLINKAEVDYTILHNDYDNLKTDAEQYIEELGTTLATIQAEHDQCWAEKIKNKYNAIISTLKFTFDNDKAYQSYTQDEISSLATEVREQFNAMIKLLDGVDCYKYSKTRKDVVFNSAFKEDNAVRGILTDAYHYSSTTDLNKALTDHFKPMIEEHIKAGRGAYFQAEINERIKKVTDIIDGYNGNKKTELNQQKSFINRLFEDDARSFSKNNFESGQHENAIRYSVLRQMLTLRGDYKKKFSTSTTLKNASFKGHVNKVIDDALGNLPLDDHEALMVLIQHYDGENQKGMDKLRDVLHLKSERQSNENSLDHLQALFEAKKRLHKDLKTSIYCQYYDLNNRFDAVINKCIKEMCTEDNLSVILAGIQEGLEKKQGRILFKCLSSTSEKCKEGLKEINNLASGEAVSKFLSKQPSGLRNACYKHILEKLKEPVQEETLTAQVAQTRDEPPHI